MRIEKIEQYQASYALVKTQLHDPAAAAYSLINLQVQSPIQTNHREALLHFRIRGMYKHICLVVQNAQICRAYADPSTAPMSESFIGNV